MRHNRSGEVIVEVEVDTGEGLPCPRHRRDKDHYIQPDAGRCFVFQGQIEGTCITERPPLLKEAVLCRL